MKNTSNKTILCICKLIEFDFCSDTAKDLQLTMSALTEEQRKKAAAGQAQELRERVKKYLNAARAGDVKALKDIVREDGGDKKGETAFMSNKEATGKNCLHFAAAMGRAEACEYILKIAPKIVGEKDSAGNTALHMACRGGHLSVAQILVKAGAKADAKNDSGVRPMQHVDNPILVKFLCENGADPNAKSEAGTPLHFAASQGYEPVVKELLKQGAKPNGADAQGLTPIIIAAASGCGSCVAALVDGNADSGTLLGGGITVMHMSAEMEDPKEAEVAVTALMSTSTGKKCALLKTKDGHLPIMLAANQGNKAVVEVLYEHSKLSLASGATVSSLLESGRMNKEAEDKKAKAAALAAAEKKSSSNDSANVYNLKGLESIESFQQLTMDAKSEEDKAKAQELKSEGNMFIVSKEYIKAIEKYTEAISLHGRNEVLWSNRSAAFLGAGQKQHALRDALICQKLKPEWLKAHYRVGQAYQAMDNFIDAASAFWSALKLDEKNKQLKAAFDRAVALGKKQHKKNMAEKEAAEKRAKR